MLLGQILRTALQLFVFPQPKSRGCETGDRGNANTCPQCLHEGKAGLSHVAPGGGDRVLSPGRAQVPSLRVALGNWGWFSALMATPILQF